MSREPFICLVGGRGAGALERGGAGGPEGSQPGYGGFPRPDAALCSYVV